MVVRVQVLVVVAGRSVRWAAGGARNWLDVFSPHGCLDIPLCVLASTVEEGILRF